MSELQPFQNESETLQIGELNIENRIDQLELYGSLTITRDKAGLQQALRLKALLDAAVVVTSFCTTPRKVQQPALYSKPNRPSTRRSS